MLLLAGQELGQLAEIGLQGSFTGPIHVTVTLELSRQPGWLPIICISCHSPPNPFDLRGGPQSHLVHGLHGGVVTADHLQGQSTHADPAEHIIPFFPSKGNSHLLLPVSREDGGCRRCCCRMTW